MSLTVTLYSNTSPVEKIGKSITAGPSYSCVLKENTSVLKPIISVKTNEQVYNFNYMYIPAFGRYYFIDDIVSINNDIWEIHGHIDVLETYKTEILNNTAVIKRQTSLYNTYLNDPEWKVYANEKITALKFPTTPFSKSLKALLIVAGA